MRAGGKGETLPREKFYGHKSETSCHAVQICTDAREMREVTHGLHFFSSRIVFSPFFFLCRVQDYGP